MKLHVSMKVENFDEAVKFYSGLFGLEPLVMRENYAKWDVENPSVNFVVEGGACCGTAIGLDHLGIQAGTSEELDQVAGRMRGMDRPVLDVEATTCCYAKSDKAWIKGEAGDRWEVFLTHSHDEEEYGEDRAHLLDAQAASAPSKAGSCC
ncbi:MAG: ArsI/CadI family heavy metal resistance metalloenzyme [Pseudomonadota bacterium]